ncbi:TetR/AcrR family transcriptional regulator [Streptomyces mirabilis]|jgi:AcrR family transcriptional regulator|uniref:Transcriptional regulator, TetR family n=1 Tax=Streptomyces mirabilis TaxID=68239 RepID=A0A1I2NL72_9ACTN|nr:TetR/AcrR family transcriptional regulator [Streptomyces mirabilis]SFG04323.1 transcriptional regulator, TetR family [Streptomyces mirabilis]
METAARRTRRRTPEREAEFCGTVLELLREVGYDTLTMDTVAARTQSSKATLYRQYGNKAQLVCRALRHEKRGGLEEIDTGTLRGDLHELVSRGDDCGMERDSALMQGLAMAVRTNPDLRGAFKDLLIEPELCAVETMLRRAVDRGEVRVHHPALAYVPHMLVGAFMARSLIEDRPPTPDFLAAYIDASVLPALGS